MNSLKEFLDANAVWGSKSALILGSAPSAKKVKSFNFEGLRIGVGDMPVRAPEFGPYDFWVTANSYYPLPWMPNDLDAMQRAARHTLLASMSVNTTSASIEEIRNAISIGVNLGFLTVYDQRHFLHKSCTPVKKACCVISENFVKSLSIQEELATLMESNTPAYGEGSTVSLHAFALAVLLHCNPIYIAGVELPTKKANYKSYRNWFRPNEKLVSKLRRLIVQASYVFSLGATDFGLAGRDNILMDFQAIAKIAEKMDIKVFSLSKTSPLNNLNNIHYLEV